jgi:ribosomal-protein-alanine N-acetyltransferase
MTDAADMWNNWVTDPEVCHFWNWEPHQDIAETRDLLSGWIKEYDNPNVYSWIIESKATSQAIGYIYLADINDDKASVSVHYALSRKYWGQGIITEACRGVIDFAFTVLGAEKIHSHHHIDNPASGAVMRKCGMRYVKTEFQPIPHCERIRGEYAYYEICRDNN